MYTTATEIILPPGFAARPATMDDLEAAVALFDACSLAMIGGRELTLELVRAEWELPDFHLDDAVRIVFSPEGRLVGYVEVWNNGASAIRPWVWGRVHPDFEGRGIGTALMTWAEERAREAIGKVPPGARVAMQAGAYSTYRPAKRLLEKMGMRQIRQNWRMKIDLDTPPPEPRRPEGIAVRTFDRERDAEAVYRAVDEAFQDHWGHVEVPFEEGFQRWKHLSMSQDDFDPSLWFLAVEGDEIAGIALCYPTVDGDPETGYVNTLGVRRPWRKRGLGTALLQHAFGEFYRRGKKAVTLGVDASNLTGATRLYEKAGMYVHRRFDLYEKELRPGKELSVQEARE